MALTCPEFTTSQVGPYNQHLVLGCSLTQMTLNAGWGSTASSCNLGLVVDPCSHWRDEAAYGAFNTQRNSILQQPDNFQPKNALEKTPQQGPPDFPPADGFTGAEDLYRGLTRQIGQADQNKENFQIQNDPDDLGKLVWSPQATFVRKNWLGPDPGLIADQTYGTTEDGTPLLGFDINGTCVFAKFDELYFGGFIKQWEGKSGSSGSTYTVQLQNMTPILNGFNMILNSYTGTVATRFNTASSMLPVASIPSNDPAGDYNGTYFGGVRGGNHPNLVNLYGIATAFYGFSGSAWRSDGGVSAADIYFVIRSLLDPTNTYIPHSAWFPYGAIIGRSLLNRTDGSIVNTANTAFSYGGMSLSYNDLGWMPQKLAIDNRYRPMFALDLSQVPMPPTDLYVPNESITLTGFLDLISKGGNYDYQIDCVPSVNPLYSAVIRVNVVNRNIAAPILSLKTSLNNSGAVESVNYGEEFNPENVRKVIVGGPQQRVLQFTTASKNVYQETRTYDPYAFIDRANVPHALQLTSARQPGLNRASLPSSEHRWYKSFIIGGALAAQQTTTGEFFTAESNGLQAAKVLGNYKFSTTAPMPVYNDVIHSYPLSSDLISPYYGIDSRGVTRPVYYDKYMGQIQILTSMNDWLMWCNYNMAPGILVSQPEQPDKPPPPAPSAAPAAADEEDVPQAPQPPNIPGEDDEPNPPQYAAIGAWIITETEIRAAKAGLDQFVSYLFDEYKSGFRGFTAVLFYNYIQYNFGAEVANKLNAGSSFRKAIMKSNITGKGDIDSSNGGGFTQGNAATTGVIGDYRIRLELEALRKFLAEEIGKHHAKEYAIRMPQVYSYIDRQGNSQYSYVPIGEGWEEEGSPLDDTMVFGGSFANYLANQNGTMGPILGYNASMEYDRQTKKVSDDDITATPLPPLDPSPTPKDPKPSKDNLDGEIPLPPDADGAGNAPPNAPPEEIELPGDDNSGTKSDTLTEAPDMGNTPVRSENSRGWYCPLNTESLSGSSDALYLTSAGQMRAIRQDFYGSIGVSLPAGFATYDTSTDAHLQRQRNLACFRKLYVKASLKEIAPKRKGDAKKFGYNYMHGSNPMVVLAAPSKIEQKKEKGIKLTLLIQKALFNFYGYSVPKESGYSRNWEEGKMIVTPDGKEWTTRLANNEVKAEAKRRNNLIDGQTTGESTDESADNLEFNDGVFAIPNFAAVPIKSNVDTYGPWASVPGLVEDVIFNNSPALNAAMADNLVGGVEVNVDAGAVPWNYGGIEYLDYAKLTEASAGIKAQQGLEKGGFSSAGIVLQDGLPVSIGSLVAGSGPIINSLSVNIGGNGGVKTNYTLRTWAKKVGFYNEERAKEIQRLGQQGVEFRQNLKDVNLAIASIPDQVLNAVDKALLDSEAKEKDKAKKTSPGEALVGCAYPYIPDGASFADAGEYSPSWAVSRTSTGGNTSGPENTYQHIGQTKLYDNGEFAAKEIKDNTYNYQSMMSLDGIISPISFYPTPYGSTFSITKYSRPHCPYCRGTGRYNYNTYSATTVSKKFAVLDDLDVTSYNEACTFCITAEEKAIERERGADLSVTIRQPPYIVDYGTDSDIDDDGNSSGDECEDGKTLINYTTLTPVVMSSTTGEFAVSANRQDGDLCAHSIRMVGVGWLPPDGDESLFIDSTQNRTKNYSDYDISYTTRNNQFIGNVNQGEPGDDNFADVLPEEAGNIDENFKASNNARFMGLRGPLMLHSWGYDLDGYPVPNASGDPLFTEEGEPVYDSAGNKVYSNQKQLPDGSYTDPFPTQQFAKNWASAPNTWPVGPIDLRWNAAAKVWTVGVEYSDVYVTLENDLNGTDPVRAVLKDGVDNTDPLPDGFRKLVFVQDANGSFAAPRGTTLYAKYNVDTGYYNPIYNTTTFSSGVVIGGNAASIYVEGTEYDVGFDNPLNITINPGNAAIFMFLDGTWIIQSTSC